MTMRSKTIPFAVAALLLVSCGDDVTKTTETRTGIRSVASLEGAECADGSADGNAYMAVLADVLRNRRKQGDIFVRYEAAQRCFHITANR